jgi:acetolactate synthase-1/2/3 large subunit
LSFPSDLLAAELSDENLCLLQRRAPAARSDFRSAALDELWSELERARRPVFYVGDDAGAGAQQVFELAAAFSGSVVTSPGGKRWVAHDMEHYEGVLGFSGHSSAASAVREADLVVAFGATFDELSTNAWTVLPSVKTFVVDAHDSFAYRVPLAHPIIFEPSDACTYLVGKLPRTALRGSQERVLARTSTRAAGTSGPSHPTDLMRWLSDNLPSHVVVHVDTGNGFAWSTRDMTRSRSDTYRVAMGLSTMGWAIGATLGAAIATRERTIGIVGDGSMLMSSLELSVAVQEKLPVTYVVLNDSGLGMVRHGQRLAGAPSIAHEIGDVRFDLIGRACGAAGFRVERLPDLESIPRCYFGSEDRGPCVIDVVIDRDAVPPMLDRVLGLQQKGTPQ